MGGVAEQRNHEVPPPEAGPSRPSEVPERHEQPRTVSAMLFSMVPLVLVAIVAAGLLGECSFNPLGPSADQSTAPTVDVDRQLHVGAQRAGFPVVAPKPPWRANSAGVDSLPSGAHSVRVGWVTGTHYLRLAQSNAPEQELVSAETEQPPRAEGVTRAAGRQWVVYAGVRSEKAWVTDKDGVRLLITGSGDDAEFRTLAQAAVTGQPA